MQTGGRCASSASRFTACARSARPGKKLTRTSSPFPTETRALPRAPEGGKGEPEGRGRRKSQGQSEGAEKLMVGAPKPFLERLGARLRVCERLFRRCVPMLAPPELGVGESDPVR